MRVFALSDPHLSFSNPDKKMDMFGEVWTSHPDKLKLNWTRTIAEDDIVLVPGDISWARKFEQALGDLQWLHDLPGIKVILKGNHDYWWPKNSSLKHRIPPSLHIIRNNHVQIGPFVFFGARLWDTQEYSCDTLVKWDITKGNYLAVKTQRELEQQEEIYTRELHRLGLSIASLPGPGQARRIGLCHYPPLPPDLSPSRASHLFETAGAEHVVFGHLHSLKDGLHPFGSSRGTSYHLASSDFLGFKPLFICADS